MNRIAAIRVLTRLLKERAAIKRGDSTTVVFRKWHRASLRVLREAFGADSSYVDDFEEIKFKIEPGLIERAKRTARKIIRGDEGRNVVQIHSFPLPLRHAETHHFEQAVDRASEILLSAKIELKARVEN